VHLFGFVIRIFNDARSYEPKIWLQRVSAEIGHHQVIEYTEYFEGTMEIEVFGKETRSHFANKL
jgi:hypothetical protein